jgi:polysaccharide biosynthesis transport protein
MKVIQQTSTSRRPGGKPASAQPPATRGPKLLDLHAIPALDLLEVPLYRKWTILACLTASFLAGWLAILVWPRTYVSHAELLFQVGRENVALDPTVTTGPTLLLQKTQEEDLNSALQILQSRRVLELVVERLGVDAILADSLPGADDGRPPGLWEPVKAGARNVVAWATLVLGLRDEISSRELAVMKLSGAVSFDAPRKSSVVTVEATARNPEMAQAIAGSVVEAFLELQNQTLQTKGSREFFVSQTAVATSRLLAVQEQKRQFLEQQRAVSLEARHDVLKQQLASIEIDLLSTVRELEQALARSQQLTQDAAALADTTVSGEQDIAATNWGNLRQRVYDLELQEARESAKFADESPRLVATRRELASAREILANFQNSAQRDTSLAPNPLKQKLQEELTINNAAIAGWKSGLTILRTQRSQLEGEIAAQLMAETELAKIERDIELFTNSLRLLREKEEEARVIEELRSEGISSVSQFQPATFVERPITPNKKLLLAGFLLFGLMGGIGLAYYREIHSGTFRVAYLASQRLTLPLIGVVHEQAGLRQRTSLSDRVRNSDELLQVCQNLLSEVFGRPDGGPGVPPRISLGVLGIEQGNGASTLALALATGSSEDFQVPTVLVEGGRAERTISVEFGLEGVPGLVELSQGKSELESCIQPAYRQSLSVVARSAMSHNNDLVGLSWEELAVGLRAIQESTELTVVDLPAATSLDRAVGLAQHVDYLVIVIEAGKTQIEVANRFLRTLPNSDVHILGVVMNKAKRHWMTSLLKVR